jgi:hypothetical protein
MFEVTGYLKDTIAVSCRRDPLTLPQFVLKRFRGNQRAVDLHFRPVVCSKDQPRQIY